MSIVTTTVRRIANTDEKDVAIEVGNDRDTGELIHVRASSDNTRQYYGEVDLVLSPEMAKALARALIEVSHAVENDSK